MLNHLCVTLHSIGHLLGKTFEGKHLRTNTTQSDSTLSQGEKLICQGLKLYLLRGVFTHVVKGSPNFFLFFTELEDWQVKFHQGLIVLIVIDRAGMSHSNNRQRRFLRCIIECSYGGGFIEPEPLVINDICAHVDLKFALLISDNKFIISIILNISECHQLRESVYSSDIIIPSVDPRRFRFGLR